MGTEEVKNKKIEEGNGKKDFVDLDELISSCKLKIKGKIYEPEDLTIEMLGKITSKSKSKVKTPEEELKIVTEILEIFFVKKYPELNAKFFEKNLNFRQLNACLQEILESNGIPSKNFPSLERSLSGT